jgi:multidrug efflux pump subunit AcrB
MNKLVDFSMKNVAAVFILILLLFGGGLYASSTLKVESMPDISFPLVFISTSYQAPPKDVLDQVTKPLEKAVANVNGLVSMTSSSSDNYSLVTIQLEQGKDPEVVKKDVESLVNGISLPQQSEKPKVMTFGFATDPVYTITLHGSEGMKQTELDSIYKASFLPGFQTLKGIDHVDSVGNQEASLTIRLDAGAITAYGLTPSAVGEMIKASLVSSPAGSVEVNGHSKMLRVTGDFNTIYNLENLKITLPRGDTLLLKEIAHIEALQESRFISRLDGKPAISVFLYKTKTANVVEFAQEADRLMEGWRSMYPQIQFHTVINNAASVKESINGMLQEGLLGALLASVMILVFLRNVRMTLIVLVSIPLSILITLLFMSALNISLNIMTLGGMAIAIGRVVDDSIVVIENIYAQLQKAQERNESVIRMATLQVGSAITSSTLTTVAVFGPIAFVSGTVGEVFRPFALTLACALMASLLVALTVIPMLAKLMVLQTNAKHHAEDTEDAMTRLYRRTLIWSLKRRWLTMLIAVAMFIGSFIVAVPNLATSFMPESATDRIMEFNLRLPKETTMEQTDRKLKELEGKLRDAKSAEGQPYFTSVVSMVGYDYAEDRVPNIAHIFAEAAPGFDAKTVLHRHTALLQQEVPKDSEITGRLLTLDGGGGSEADFSYSLKGDSLTALQQAAAQVKERLKQFPELNEIEDSLSDSKSEIEVTVDQNKARLHGLNSMQVMQSVAGFVAEEKLGELKFDQVLYQTKVSVDPKYKNSVEKIGQLPLQSASGATVRLHELAKIQDVEAPVAIDRDMQMQVVKVTARIDSKDKGGVSAKLTAALNELKLPQGVSREVKGVGDDINKSFSEMFVAMGASIFIVYLVMVIAFGNAGAPFAILFSLPLAAIGGLLGLLITNESINVTSLIGFLMLIGIVVTNAIVLIDRVQQLREQGSTVRDAIIEAGITRLRPIIMTAGATIIALLPLALGLSHGTLISKGLAVVVIGGLTTSTLLTLVIVPIVYEWLEALKVRLFSKRTAKLKASANAQPM